MLKKLGFIVLIATPAYGQDYQQSPMDYTNQYLQQQRQEQLQQDMYAQQLRQNYIMQQGGYIPGPPQVGYAGTPPMQPQQLYTPNNRGY